MCAVFHVKFNFPYFIIWQVLFKKQLSRKQWISLILLTVGCIVKEIHTTPSTPGAESAQAAKPFHHTFYFLLILVQVKHI